MAEKYVTAVTGLALLLAATGFVASQEAKFDKSVAMAAAEKAAGRLGQMRGSIDHDAMPELVTQEILQDKPKKETSLSPRPAWQPLAGTDPLPPMVSLDDPYIDVMMTGSVRRTSMRKPASQSASQQPMPEWSLPSNDDFPSKVVGLDDPYIDVMMTGSVMRTSERKPASRAVSLLPMPVWRPPSNDDFPTTVVSLDDPYIDTMMTGSVRRDRKTPVNVTHRFQWERFDNRGRLISH